MISSCYPQHHHHQHRKFFLVSIEPMSYQLDEKQYIAIVAGGNDMLDMKRGDYVIAYGLKGSQE